MQRCLNVGPRPERPEIAAQYEEEMPAFGLRLQVKAGLTGYAQIYGKYNTNPHDKLEMDLIYINKMGIVVDIATRTQNGEFPGGETIVYGLAEDGVGLADSRGAIPQKVLDLVEDYKAKIAAGEIEVPEAVK